MPGECQLAHLHARLQMGLDLDAQELLILADDTCSDPALFIDGVFPEAGLTDGDLLGLLAELFNADFGSDGHTLSYDASTDTLSLNEVLPLSFSSWFGDSDTSLDLRAQPLLVGSVPLPPAVGLTSAAVAALFGAAMRTSWHRWSSAIFLKRAGTRPWT